jgi:hypothetical protein
MVVIVGVIFKWCKTMVRKKTEFLAIGMTFRQALVIWCVVLTESFFFASGQICPFFLLVFFLAGNLGASLPLLKQGQIAPVFILGTATYVDHFRYCHICRLLNVFSP